MFAWLRVLEVPLEYYMFPGFDTTFLQAFTSGNNCAYYLSGPNGGTTGLHSCHCGDTVNSVDGIHEGDTHEPVRGQPVLGCR